MHKLPSLDNRSQEDLLNEFIKRASSYVPQWRFDAENPDLGTVLAVIFSTMQYDTISKYKLLPLKWETDFYNQLQTSLQPETPAKGYVHFGLSNDEVEGVEISAKTALKTEEALEDGSMILAETIDDVYVCQSELCAVYESFDQLDYIGNLFTKGEEKPYPLFQFEHKNLQTHIFYMSHPDLLAMKGDGEIRLSFYQENNSVIDEEFLDMLVEFAEFSYSSKEGFIPFSKKYRKGHHLLFERSLREPPFVEYPVLNLNQCFIKCQIPDGRPFAKMKLKDVRLNAKAEFILPQNIYASGISVEGRIQYYPFGEKPSIYEEVYFADDEVLRKKGAMIELSFINEFIEIPLDFIEKTDINMKLIMPRVSVKVEKEFNITIARVIFEYFNGTGFVSLFPEGQYEDIFSLELGTYRQKKVIRFICPLDISPMVVGGLDCLSIRARILKINNSFKSYGKYITPIISDTYFSYKYKNEGIRPEYFVEENNCSERLITADKCLEDIYGYSPVRLANDKVPTVYLGFRKPLIKGPIRLLLVLGLSENSKRPQLKWQYYNGVVFENLNPADETMNLNNSGLISFNGITNHGKKLLFGEDLYWIRIQDITGGYFKAEPERLPNIQGIYMNGVRVVTIDGGEKTNLSEGDITGLDLAKGFVNLVYNPISLWGGSRRELPEEAMKRKAEEYKHGFRAVTTSDYEKLALNASESIYKATCFSSMTGNGDKRSGHITLVLLLEAYKKGYHYFPALKEQLLFYFKDKVFTSIITSNRLHIILPNFIQVKISVELGVKNFNDIFSSREKAERILAQFLDPMEGNFSKKGFRVGVMPKRNQIETLLKTIEKVQSIRNLIITGSIQKGGSMIEINIEEINKIPYVLPMNGEHKIVVNAEY